MADVTAVIVTYNSEDTIDTALWSLLPSYRAGLSQCLVVDNASTDGTVECVQQHPWVTLIRSERNVGFGRGCNLGLQHVSSRYVLFMNPDAVISQGNLKRLLDFMRSHPRAGLVGPAIVESDGQLQTAGGLPTPFGILGQAAGRPSHSSGRRPIRPGASSFQTDWLCGALLLAPTQLMQDLRGFDDRYFLYFEETDLCRRVQAAGYELWAVGEATAYHTANHSALQTRQDLYAGCIAEHYFASRFYYLAKHYGLAAATVTEAVELVLLTLRAAMTLVKGQTDHLVATRFRAPKFRFPRMMPL